MIGELAWKARAEKAEAEIAQLRRQLARLALMIPSSLSLTPEQWKIVAESRELEEED